VLVFAIGLGFNFLGLWQLAVLLWIPAFSILLMALVGLAFFIAYVSKVILIYFFIKWILAHISKDHKVYMDLLGLLVGTILYALLRSIPYAGWVVDLVVTSAGMGAAWFALRNLHLNPKEETKEITQSGMEKSTKKH
jgi:hypothetical protein